LSNNIFFKNSRLKIDLGIQQNIRNEFGNVLDPNEKELSMQLTTSTVNAVYFFPETKDAQLSAGVNLQHQANTNKGEEALIPDYQTNDAGAFVFFRKYTAKWFFSAGVRSDIRVVNAEGLYLDSNGIAADSGSFTTTKFSAFEKNFLSYSGVIGASYQMNKQTVWRLNFSRGFRSPNMSELASNGKHEGTFRYETGNRLLDPETSLQADLGMTFTSDHFNLEVSTFYNSIQNFTYLSKLNSALGGDSIADPSDPAPVFTFVQGNAALFGGEIYSDIHPHPLDWLHFENSLSFVQGVLRNQPDSMTNLPFIPPMKYQSEINAHAEKQIGPMKNAYFMIAAARYFAQNKVYSAFGTETATPGYWLMEAGAGTDLVNKKGAVVCRVFLSANNLLNTAYQSHLSRLKYAPENPLNGRQGLYGQGRNFSIRIVIPVNIKS
jgi:iron complex outermembrane receptor protein